MSVVIIVFALIALLILACAYYMPTQLEEGEAPVYKSLMGI